MQCYCLCIGCEVRGFGHGVHPSVPQMQARVPVTSTCSGLQRGAGLYLDKTRKLFCAHEAGKEILQIVGNQALHLAAKYRGREFAAKKEKKRKKNPFRELKRAVCTS